MHTGSRCGIESHMAAEKRIWRRDGNTIAVTPPDATEVGSGEAGGRASAQDRITQRPEVLASYLQLSFNAVLLVTLLVLLFKFISIVREDVKHKLRLRMASELSKIKVCEKNYEKNGCLPGEMVPALDELCADWLQCMSRDSTDTRLYQSGALWAQTLAEIINSFVEPISLKSILMILLTFCTVVTVTNVAFRFYRVYYY